MRLDILPDDGHRLAGLRHNVLDSVIVDADGRRAAEAPDRLRRGRAADVDAVVADVPEIRYRIEPEERLELFEAIEADGRDVVGFCRSHPTGPARPSETDAARAT